MKKKIRFKSPCSPLFGLFYCEIFHGRKNRIFRCFVFFPFPDFFGSFFRCGPGLFFVKKLTLHSHSIRSMIALWRNQKKIPKTIEKRRLFIVRKKILKKNPLFFPPSGFPLRIFFLSPVETAKAPQETAWEPPRHQSWKTSLFIVKQLTFLRLKPHR